MASTPPFTRIGMGCARVGSLTNPSSPAESQRLIELAFALGVRLFDTANIYGQGDSERILGRALAGKRDQAFIVTKIGKRFSAKMRLIRPFKPLVKRLRRPSPAGDAFVASQRAANVGFDLDHRTMERDVAAALKRLRIERIDMLLLHSPSAATVADPAVIDTLSAIRAKGMIAGYGVSADSADVVAAALAMPGIGMVQAPYVALPAAAPVPLVARGVLRHRGTTPPMEALAAAVADPRLAAVLVETTSPDHLRAAAALL
ncbi:aldo/keto reductase [Sphingomonas flavalba]|uniref:aldo/keto reductase n=1 Tax=Sphingomonas flavalba TaxID=2559804 RepID=UPI0039E18029